jgi:hypothetical protein
MLPNCKLGNFAASGDGRVVSLFWSDREKNMRFGFDVVVAAVHRLFARIYGLSAVLSFDIAVGQRDGHVKGFHAL